MICHVPELGDEAPIVGGLADIECAKHYRGPMTAEVWETRPHTLLISRASLNRHVSEIEVDPGDHLKISLAPELLRR